MKALGSLPDIVPAANILESIGENILIADLNYNVVWINPIAAKLLSQ
ncbi:MAG TPA: RsbR, positive regulator of sigma-B, partial [Bacillus bacterium]|nr:RsbR, positive regulator of sigma-B [Bacillus sp. (in: firmicutes)]